MRLHPSLRRLARTAGALLPFVATLPAQETPPPKVEWFAAGAADAAAPAWQPLLDRATMSIGRYRLAKGTTDGQQPHDRDEVYCVLQGKAQFTAADETRAVGPGDAIFVAAGAAHRFHDITEDLDVLVVFSTARPATGGMMEGPKPTEQTPYAETSPRASTRIFYWYGPDSAGQVAIDHGQPRWNRAYAKFLDQPSGRRWRLGENFWTTLDTNMDLVLGDTEVQKGMYYCALQHTQRGLELVLLDPAAVRDQRLDAYEAPKTTGGLLVPLQRRNSALPTTRLQAELSVDRSARDRGALVFRFGPHELFVPLQMRPHR
ncbi:MAG: cupin domain-containing protein [Planctomycetota bacterium]